MWNEVSDTTGIAMVEGSGVLASETRELPPFGRVELMGSNQVTIHVGAAQSVVVHADDNILDRVTTRVSAGRLLIGNEAGGFTTRSPMRVEVAVPACECKQQLPPVAFEDFSVRTINSDVELFRQPAVDVVDAGIQQDFVFAVA